MEERIRGAIIRSVEHAGRYLMNPNGAKKSAAEIEKRARDIILREIKNADPQLSLWGEGRGRAVSVCPIDNLLNYSKGYGGFGVMAAYIEGGMPVFGAIHLPMSGETASAERGKGARMQGRRIRAGERSDLQSAIVCTVCDCYVQDMGEVQPAALDFIAKFAFKGMAWRNSGSPCSDFYAVATGQADAMVVPVLESAHAAGYLVMEESGALVTDIEGRPYSLHSQGILGANPELHGLMMDFIADQTR
jgi:myo-inositol-1(or 4)-monophosphatase